jgi:hypothetical protein
VDEIISHLLDQPLANVIALAGLVFLFIGAVGKISGKIEPDFRGRIICGILGLGLVIAGLFLHGSQDSPGKPTEAQTPPSTNESTTARPGAKKRVCKAGYIRRMAVPDDLVCVTQSIRNTVAVENALAPSRIKNGGQYGADTCIEGFVWREAVPVDHICVTPERRDQTKVENAEAASRAAP